MARSSTFLREQRNLVAEQKGASISAGYASPPYQAKGFKVVTPTHSTKPKPIRVREEQFVEFLVEDVEKHPEKLVPFTADMLAHAKELLNGVELD
jgi:hypothetical protein